MIRIAALLAAGAFFLSPTGAEAQMVPGTPYIRTDSSATYLPLSNPTVLWNTADEEVAPLTLPFPVKFYDANETEITVGANGAVVFGTVGSIFNSGAPGASASLDGWIAPFIDDLEIGPGGYIGYETEGTAPTRTFTVEFNNISEWLNPTMLFSYQIRLFEGAAGRIQVQYGPVTGTGNLFGAMGMEDQAGVRPILFDPAGCTSACNQAQLAGLMNTQIDLVQDPGIELQAGAVFAPEFAFLNASGSIDVLVQNLHGTALGPFAVELRAGTGPDVQNPVSLGSLVISLGPFQGQAISVPATFPNSLGETTVYVEARVDPANVVIEVDENNNRVVSATPTRLLVGRPDLAVTSVSIDQTQVSGNGTFNAVTEVTNVGGMPTGQVDVAIMLSSNPVISPQDLELGRFTVSLAPAESVTTTTAVTLNGVSSGSYLVGGLADPDGALTELSEVNNGVPADTPLVVAGGNLAITTVALPMARVGETYNAQLSAVGGDAAYSWEVISGMLPGGLGIVPATGELFGRANTVGMETFTVRVTSGTDTAEATFTLVVSDPAEPLTVVTRTVSPGTVGQEYTFTLIATGGGAGGMLSWSSTELPSGFTLTAEGLLAGTPDTAGSSTVTVSVTDGTETASRDLVLHVRENANLLIVLDPLPVGRFGEPYMAQLAATGGVQPISFILDDGPLPTGLTLSQEGLISGTPLQAGIFTPTIRAFDSGGLGAVDINTFTLEIVDSGALIIETTGLPETTLGSGFSATIKASGGLPPYEWTIEEGRLPPGLLAQTVLQTSEFAIEGAPSELGVTNLLISVTDTQGLSARRAFAIVVREVVVTEPEPSGGCRCATSQTGTGGALLLMLLGLLWRAAPSGRSRPRSSCPPRGPGRR